MTRTPGVTFRPEPDERAQAADALPAGVTMDSFLRACLRAVATDTEAVMAVLQPHWPPPRRTGRPPTGP